MTDADLPADPDLDFADPDLRLLAGLNRGRVVVLDGDGVSCDVLVLVPALHRRAHELEVGED